MNLPCLFASSDVLYREEMHLASCFSTLAVKKEQSSGSVKSWPSVGETWIDGRLFHGFCTVYFTFFAIQSCTQFLPLQICLQNHASIISLENCRISDFLSTLHPVNTRMDTVHFDFTVTCFCRLKGGEICWMKCEKRGALFAGRKTLTLSWLISLTLCRSPQMHLVSVLHSTSCPMSITTQFILALTFPIHNGSIEEQCETTFCRGSFVWQWQQIVHTLACYLEQSL